MQAPAGRSRAVTGVTATVISLTTVPFMSSRSWRARLTFSLIRRAWPTSRCPYGVSCTPLFVRTNSAAPTLASSSLMALLSAGWVTWSRRDASCMLPVSETAANARN
jgi:hypothetical protein